MRDDEFERGIRTLTVLDEVRWPGPLDAYYISGYIPMTHEALLDFARYNNPPMYGPPVPTPLRLWRQLGGRPFGPYRRAS